MVTIADLVEQLIQVINDFHASRNSYLSAHPTFSKEKDARLTLFGKTISTLDMALLYLMFRTFQLPYEGWWSSLSDEFRRNSIPVLFSWKPDELDRARIIATNDKHWALSLIVLLFAILESSIRWIALVVYSPDPYAGRGDLTKIYENLLSIKYPKYEKLLELFRLCRNLHHNNGVYFTPRPGDDRHVPFKGKIYHFIDIKPVELGDVPRLLLFDIVPELLKMIEDILNSSEVSKHSAIIDPSMMSS